jgi:preprotein translocase subunit SecY
MSAARHTYASVSADDLAFRLGITLVALMVYRLGCHLPVPGLDPQFVPQLAKSSTTAERCSIFALGMMPLFRALALAELLKVLVPAVRQWEQVDLRNRYELNRMVLVLALALAVWQARDMAFALEASKFARGSSQVVPEPGPMFRIPYIIIIVAATAFLAWLADQITCKGVGSGFWLLWIAPTLAGLPARTVQFATWLGQGEISMMQLVAGISFVVLAIALISGAVEADGQRRPLAIWFWPPILAYSSLKWLLDAETFLRGPHSAPAWFAPGQPAYLLSLGLLIAFFALLEARSLRLAKAGSSDLEMKVEMAAVPVAIVAAVPIVIAIAAELLKRQLGVPLLIGGEYMITIVMLSILGALGLSARARAYFTRAT